MKFTFNIGGVETFFPEIDICYFQEENRMVVYFLNNNQFILDKVKNNKSQPKMKFEDMYIVLSFTDFQFAFNTEGYSKMLELYNLGCGIGFSFEDQNGNLLQIPTPTFYK